MRVGQVAVPFGTCTEPSNVKAGGQACPYKFTCLGCGHFRSDPSYLPELKSYLQQLLADRERLRAATGLQEWARAQLTPRDEEITQLRELIRRIEADVSDLSEQDQACIAEAITVIRKTRQVVNLGIPATQPPSAKTGCAAHDHARNTAGPGPAPRCRPAAAAGPPDARQHARRRLGDHRLRRRLPCPRPP